MKAHPETTSPAVLDDLPRGPDPAREGVATAVFRHWRLIAGLAIIGALGAFVLSQRLTPLYTATATVMIDPHEPKLAAQATDPMSFMPPSEEDVRQNEVAVIRSRNLAAKVISGLKLLQLSEFNPSLRPPSRMRELLTRAETMLEGVLRAIGLGSNIAPQHGSPVERERERAIDIFLTHLTTAETSASRVIDIRFSSANPERAAAVANAVANQYIGLKVAQDLAEARAETEALERQIHHLNDIIRAEEYAIERVRTEQGGVPADNLRVVSELMTNLNRELVVAVADRAAAEARIAELNKATFARYRLVRLGTCLSAHSAPARAGSRARCKIACDFDALWSQLFRSIGATAAVGRTTRADQQRDSEDRGVISDRSCGCASQGDEFAADARLDKSRDGRRRQVEC